MAAFPPDILGQPLLDNGDSQDGPRQLASLLEEDVSIAQQIRPPDVMHPPAAIMPLRQPQTQPQQHAVLTQNPDYLTPVDVDSPTIRDRLTYQHVLLLLDRYRAIHAQLRKRLGSILDEILISMEKVTDSESVKELQVLRAKLRETDENLKLYDGRIKDLEHEASSAAHTPDMSEQVFQEPQIPLEQLLPAQGPDTVLAFPPPPVPLAQQSPPVPHTDSSALSQLRTARQQVGFSKQRLEELDYDHLVETDVRGAARSQGESLDPPDDEFDQMYETMRINLKDELVMAEKRVHELEMILDQTVVDSLNVPVFESPQIDIQTPSASRGPSCEAALTLTSTADNPLKPSVPEGQNTIISTSLYSRVQSWLGTTRQP